MLLSKSAAQNPDLVAALSPLMGNIDDSTMREANRSVDLNHRPVAEVARDLSAQLPN
jgi:glycine betaine/choline ABC-type transport system substrate-binding protein